MDIYQSYTYKISWTTHNIHYYGVRYGNKHSPSDDLWIHYFTSSKYVNEFREKHGEPDIILIDKEFDNAQDAIDYEDKMLREAYENGEWEIYLNKRFGNAIIHDEETKRKISESQIGVSLSDETKRKMSKTRQRMAKEGIGVGENNPMYGKRATLEWSKKLSDASAKKNKIIYTFQHESGETFTGLMSEFYKKYNLCRAWTSRVISGEKKSIKGWKLI